MGDRPGEGVTCQRGHLLMRSGRPSHPTYFKEAGPPHGLSGNAQISSAQRVGSRERMPARVRYLNVVIQTPTRSSGTPDRSCLAWRLRVTPFLRVRPSCQEDAGQRPIGDEDCL